MSAWVLTGPTASGKSAVAHQLAEQMEAVVLCADAMTVYRGLDIGTAKPDASMRARVPYFGLDLVDPDQTFSVGKFCSAAREAKHFAERTGRPLIVVGGSGLYLSAILRGLEGASPADPVRRMHWERVYRDQGVLALQAALKALSPSAFQALADPQNPRRLIRALERAESGAPSPTTWRTNVHMKPVCGLLMESSLLKARIAERARSMLVSGLIEEAARIRSQRPILSQTARHAIGYEEAFGVLDGRLTESEAIDRIARRTWQLARRQMTWFRHQFPVSWVHVTADMSATETATAVRRQWEQDGPSPLHL